MKRTLKEWMPLIVCVAGVAVPLVLFGLRWWWPPPFFTGFPLPLPIPN